MGAGEGLIATSASPIGAASAIASGWIAWIARAVECGIIAAQPTGDDPALGRGIIAPVGQQAVARRDLRDGPANASSVGSKPAMYRRPQLRMPSSRLS